MKERKKIAVICNYRLMPDRVGGMDRFFWMFDKKCKDAGHEIVWFFPNVSKQESYDTLTIQAPDNNQSLEHFFIHYIQVNNVKFDVVITHFLELCTSFFKEVKKFHASKTIAVDHNPRPINGYPFKKQLQKKIKGMLYAKYTNLFIGVSGYTKENILKDFGNHLQKKTVVVYNGIVHELYRKRESRNFTAPTFLVACHLRFSKGIQDLISAVALLPESIKEVMKIAVYGQGEYQQELERMVTEKKLLHIFDFKGSVPNLYETYFQYDYLLQPTHMECFSLSILESLAANVPVITTSVGGNEEVVKHGQNGYIFKPKDISSLKNHLEELFLGKIAITKDTSVIIAEKFSIEKMVEEHYKLIKN